MPPAPKTVGGCVVVAYTAIDARHRPTGGCRHVVAGVVQGPAAGLAICECEPGPDHDAAMERARRAPLPNGQELAQLFAEAQLP